MSPIENRYEQSLSRVRMFNADKFNAEMAKQNWDQIKIVCTQPFYKHMKYGISFIKVHTLDLNSPRKKFGAFALRDEEEDSLMSPVSENDLQAEAAAIKSKMNVVSEETQALEVKLKRTKSLHIRLAILKASSDLLRPAKASKLKIICNYADLRIARSDKIQDEIARLEQKMVQLKRSEDLLRDEERTRLLNEKTQNEAKLKKSREIEFEILRIQHNENLLSKEDTQQLEEKVKSVRKIIGSGNTLLEKQNKARRDLECSICLDIPKVDKLQLALTACAPGPRFSEVI